MELILVVETLANLEQDKIGQYSKQLLPLQSETINANLMIFFLAILKMDIENKKYGEKQFLTTRRYQA